MPSVEEVDQAAEAVVQWAKRRWTWIVVTVLGVFMFRTRMRPAERFNTGDAVYFFGTDPYYHARQILYTVRNFPSTLAYDPWTQYPLGTSSGQFGTLFDQIAAALAWIVGLVVDGGAPTLETILDVAVAYPALLGALTIVPIFLLARDLFGRGPAVFVAVATALIPGTFLLRSTAAVTDHHILEALFSTLAVWAAYRALKGFEDADPTLDDLVEDPLLVWREHRDALTGSLLAALALWAYLATWPPGVLFIGILGGWLVVETLLEVARERDPGAVVATGATMFTFLAILMLPYAIASPSGGFSALNFTWMQPVAPLLVAGSLVALALIGRAWRERSLPRWGYPPAAVGLGLVSLGVLSLVTPSLVNNVLNGASWVFDSTLGWVPGIGVERTRLTIQEAQPASFDRMYPDFGFLFYTAIAGWILSVIDLARGVDREDALLSVWAFVAISGAFTQSRFMYYLAIVVLMLSGKLAAKLFAAAEVMAEPPEGKGADSAQRIDPRTGKVVVSVLLALALLPVNVLGFSSGECRGDLNSWALAGCLGPDEEARSWTTELDWLRENTPAGPVSLTTAYSPPPSGERFDYPDGAYGVLSWWDYGHQIEFQGRRAPIANPFQQQAPLASEIFTSRNESSALALLDDYLGEGNRARYLMIDDAMITGKFSAITVWADEERTYRQGGQGTFRIEANGNTSQVRLPTIGDEIRSMFLQDVYRSDGSGFEHYRLVREHPRYSAIGNRGSIQEGNFQLTSYNRVLLSGGPDRIRGNFGSLTFSSGDRALGAGNNAYVYDVEVESALKTYERVPGATLTGTGEPGAEVSVQLPLEVRLTERTFVYGHNATVGPDGTFEVTVPYSTTDPVPVEEGGTKLGVTARGPYEVQVDNRTATADVPDATVLDGGVIPVSST